jgi:hypothetical protein
VEAVKPDFRRPVGVREALSVLLPPSGPEMDTESLHSAFAASSIGHPGALRKRTRAPARIFSIDSMDGPA